MGNCLVTKLKESVNNDTLTPLGAFRLHINGNTQIAFGTPCVKKIIGDGSFATSLDFIPTKVKESTEFTVKIATQNGCDLIVQDDYALVGFNNTEPTSYVSGDFSFLKYRTLSSTSIVIRIADDSMLDASWLNFVNLASTQLIGKNIRCDKPVSETVRVVILRNSSSDVEISNLNGENVYYIELSNCPNIYGNLSSFANKVNLTTLICPHAKLTGSISSLENLQNLVNLSIHNNQLTGDISALTALRSLTNCTVGMQNVEGNVNTLLENWWKGDDGMDNGRKSGTCIIGFHTSNCVFHGQTLSGNTDMTVTFTANGMTLTHLRGAARADLPATFDGTSWHYAND